MIRRRTAFLLAATSLLLSCNRGIEPGLYKAPEGYVRVYLDSLGQERALMYRDTSGVWADTASVDLKAIQKSLKPYVAPEFHRFPRPCS